ncbi:hypothetical protein [Priestia megaterium]|uniref:Uncharacterized protein n=1 Tax=Priestia megaterium TaxID=1404 RepID=A0A6M6E1B8_PRIMG|nr:hypothetical protein [Priestia megaterium]QJX80732.1 hypothetical protein FDZ14_32090 [Priestia megaterium]
MIGFHDDASLIASNTLREIADFVPGDYEIHHVLIDSSALYQEIHILFSFELEKGIFQSNQQLRELRYDLVNKCGIMFQIFDKKERKPKVVKTYGDISILREKAWI